MAPETNFYQRSHRQVIQPSGNYQPRHKSVVDDEFCENKCVIIDGIKVPFPDCQRHGKPFSTNTKCGIINVWSQKS